MAPEKTSLSVMLGIHGIIVPRVREAAKEISARFFEIDGFIFINFVQAITFLDAISFGVKLGLVETRQEDVRAILDVHGERLFEQFGPLSSRVFISEKTRGWTPQSIKVNAFMLLSKGNHQGLFYSELPYMPAIVFGQLDDWVCFKLP